MLDQAKTAFRDWRDYSQKELDDNYNQNSLVPDNSPYKERKVRESEKARATLECRLDIPYGPSRKEKLDIFPAAQKGAPINIFIHGGAWKSGNDTALACSGRSWPGRSRSAAVSQIR